MTDRLFTERIHRSELGDWELATARAAQPLRTAVKRYAGYREHSPGVVRRLEPASARAVLVISFGPKLRLTSAASSGDATEVTSFIAGPGDRWVVTEYAGVQHGIQVDLSPLALSALLRDTPNPNDVARLEDLVLGESLVDQLASTRSWPARFDLLDRFLVERLGRARPARPEVAEAVASIERTGGRVTVKRLSAQTGWSRRHLTAEFKNAVGLTPGRYGRVVRFRRALALIQSGSRSFADSALESGFFDQSHLDRDFAIFAGLSPSQFLARRLPEGFGTAAR